MISPTSHLMATDGRPVVHVHELPSAAPRPGPLHVAPALPEPPLLCRLGLHDLTVTAVGSRRPAGAVELCSTTSTCLRPRCAMSRHEQHRIPPTPRAWVLLAAATAAAGSLTAIARPAMRGAIRERLRRR